MILCCTACFYNLVNLRFFEGKKYVFAFEKQGLGNYYVYLSFL